MHRMDMHAYYLKLLSSEKYLCFIVIFCHNEFMHLRIYGLENTLNGKKKKKTNSDDENFYTCTVYFLIKCGSL